MQPRYFAALVGFVMLGAGTCCPLLSPFGLIRLNLYDVNKPYGLVILLVAITGIITIVMNRPAVAKFMAWLGLLLVILLYLAATFKVHNSFSFIPFKGLAGYLSRQIRFSWGWLVLFLGALLSILTTLAAKEPAKRL